VHRSISILVLAAGLAQGAISVPAARAQGKPPGTVAVSAALTVVQQARADLDGGGDARSNSRALHLGVTRQFVPAFSAGLAVRLVDEEWDIFSPTALGGVTPWQQFQRPGASLPMSLALSPTMILGISPTVDWPHDTRTDLPDACTWGAVLSVVHVWSPGHVLGGGASVTRQFYSVKTTPFVIVQWKILERLRVANALGSGPLGGAGVELRYAVTPNWELAAGGVSRSDRWRLPNTGSGSGRVGETQSIPLLARLGRSIGSRARVDLSAGVVTAGRLTLRDSGGHDLGHDGFGPSPTVSATASCKF
jgi:hypothetical protein